MTEQAAPSGAMYDAYLFNLATQLADVGLIRWSDEPFKLKSGILSHVYVFGREDLTDNPRVLCEISDQIALKTLAILNEQGDTRQACLIGVPTAGSPLAVAASLVTRAVWPKPKIVSRIMREAVKEYGAHRTWVNGRPDQKQHCYMTVDNVITDGRSKLETIERLREDGYPVDGMPHIVLVDRQQGGVEKLRAQGIRVEPILYLLDLVWAFGMLDLWPKERVEAVKEEIAAHQL
ncbi:MAG: orotate phosphoribosyltransferase [Minisyncoccia bacterium]